MSHDSVMSNTGDAMELVHHGISAPWNYRPLVGNYIVESNINFTLLYVLIKCLNHFLGIVILFISTTLE
jgi:hypothetical protein